jgi:general secretion pathway protein J
MNGARREAGFTLLELLVAMTVLGVLTALLASGLSFGTRIWERERDQLAASSDLQLVQDVLRRMLSQAIPLALPSEAGGEQASSFLGTGSSIEFFGPPPAQSVVGGVYAYRLLIRPGPDGTKLELEWRLQPPQGTRSRVRLTNAEPEEAERMLADHQVVLLERLGSAEFEFYGRAAGGGDTATWRREWRETTGLPQLVRLKVGFPPGDPRIWPELTIAPRVAFEDSE